MQQVKLLCFWVKGSFLWVKGLACEIPRGHRSVGGTDSSVGYCLGLIGGLGEGGAVGGGPEYRVGLVSVICCI